MFFLIVRQLDTESTEFYTNVEHIRIMVKDKEVWFSVFDDGCVDNYMTSFDEANISTSVFKNFSSAEEYASDIRNKIYQAINTNSATIVPVCRLYDAME